MTETTSPAPSVNRKFVVDALILLALVVLGFGGYKLTPLLTPKTDLNLPLSTCDLGQGACMIALPEGGQVEVEISPRPILALKALQLRASVVGAEVSKVEVDFSGMDMNMGFNRPILENTGNGKFSGQATLPVCITGKMPWEATVLITRGRTVIAAPFRFEASGH